MTQATVFSGRGAAAALERDREGADVCAGSTRRLLQYKREDCIIAPWGSFPWSLSMGVPWQMGRSHRGSAIGVRPLMCMVMIFATEALADECPPVAMQTPSCAPFQQRLTADACIKPGAIFIANGSMWAPPEDVSLAHKKQRVEFFYVVDASRTKMPFGLAFVGIVRTHVPPTPNKEVALSQNKGFSFQKSSSAKTAYSAAVNWRAPATTTLYHWANVEGTQALFSASYKSELRSFDFPSAGDKDSMHARLYRFDSGGGLVCVPFWVGVTPQTTSVEGTLLDVLGGERGTDSFYIEIN